VQWRGWVHDQSPVDQLGEAVFVGLGEGAELLPGEVGPVEQIDRRVDE